MGSFADAPQHEQDRVNKKVEWWLSLTPDEREKENERIRQANERARLRRERSNYVTPDNYGEATEPPGYG